MIGQRIGGYELRELLGEGGMGAVYLAEHHLIGRKTAIKVLRRELAADKMMVERFINEARAANAIGHPGIVDVVDAGILPDGLPFLVMEYLQGENLRARIAREGRLAVETAVIYAADCASALAAAHEKGIVHRDLKPENLFLVAPTSKHPVEQLKVLDFGIAKLQAGREAGSLKTRPGSLMGTPLYMSPEQCRALPDEIGPASDIYSLGIIVYEMLCGKVPFSGGGDGGVIALHIMTAPQPLSERVAGVPAHIEAAVMRALAKPPEARFASMMEFRAALLGAPGSFATAPVVPSTLRPTKVLPTSEREAPGELRQTTLSAATRETRPVTRRGARRTGWLPLAAAGAAGAALAGFFLLRGRLAVPDDPRPTDLSRAPAESVAPAVPAPAPAGVFAPAAEIPKLAPADAGAAALTPPSETPPPSSQAAALAPAKAVARKKREGQGAGTKRPIPEKFEATPPEAGPKPEKW